MKIASDGVILPQGEPRRRCAAGLLLLYAIALFLSPDPAWTMWAAQMAMGVLYVPDSPTLQGMAPGDAVRAMSAAGGMGSIAVAALLALRVSADAMKTRPSCRSLPSKEPDAAL